MNQERVARVALRFLYSKTPDQMLLRGGWTTLQALVAGEPTTLYHGTTRSFRTFDLAKSRTDLVNDYYGVGIFFSPSKRVAEKYADANRNIGFDPDIIDELKQKNPAAGGFLQRLVELGHDAWDEYFDMLREQGHEYPGNALEEHLDMDPNTLGDIAGYVIGSKIKPLSGGDGPSLFSQSTGAPEWLYANLDEVGLDSSKYRPKVYTATVTLSNPLVTSKKAEAQRARSKGYDGVVFLGPGSLVDGVPEVAVFTSKSIRIVKVEVV